MILCRSSVNLESPVSFFLLLCFGPFSSGSLTNQSVCCFLSVFSFLWQQHDAPSPTVEWCSYASGCFVPTDHWYVTNLYELYAEGRNVILCCSCFQRDWRVSLSKRSPPICHMLRRKFTKLFNKLSKLQISSLCNKLKGLQIISKE